MTAQDAIDAAFLEGGVKQIGDTPTSAERTAALSRLNAIWLGLFGNEIGPRLTDFQVPFAQRTYTAPVEAANQGFPANLSPAGSVVQYPTGNRQHPVVPMDARIICKATVAEVLYLYEQPADGAMLAYADNLAGADLTLDANGRKIEGAVSVTLTPGSTARRWFYRADLADWRLVEPLDLADDLPLPAEFDDFFVTALAIRLSALNGAQPMPGTTMQFDKLRSQIAARYAANRNIVDYGGDDLATGRMTFQQPSGSGAFARGW